MDKVYLYIFYSSVWPNNKAGEVLLTLSFCSNFDLISWQRSTYILGLCQEKITSWLEIPSFSTTNMAGKCPSISLNHMTHTFEHVGCLQKHKMQTFYTSSAWLVKSARNRERSRPRICLHHFSNHKRLNQGQLLKDCLQELCVSGEF